MYLVSNNADIWYCVHEQHSGISCSSVTHLFSRFGLGFFGRGSDCSYRIWDRWMLREFQQSVSGLDIGFGLSYVSIIVNLGLHSSKIITNICKLKQNSISM